MTSPAVCVAEDLVSQKRDNLHVARIKKYWGSIYGTEVPIEVLDLADRTTAKYKNVERSVYISKNNDGLWMWCNGKFFPRNATKQGHL